MKLVLPSVQEGWRGDSKATPAPGPSASQVLTVLPLGPQPRVAGGTLSVETQSGNRSLAIKGGRPGEFCSPARIRGCWTGLSALGSSTWPS